MQAGRDEAALVHSLFPPVCNKQPFSHPGTQYQLSWSWVPVWAVGVRRRPRGKMSFDKLFISEPWRPEPTGPQAFAVKGKAQSLGSHKAVLSWVLFLPIGPQAVSQPLKAQYAQIKPGS